MYLSVSARWSSVRMSTMFGRLVCDPRGIVTSPSASGTTGKAVANVTMATNHTRLLRTLLNIGSTSLRERWLQGPTLGRAGWRETRGITCVCDGCRADPQVVLCGGVTYVTRSSVVELGVDRRRVQPGFLESSNGPLSHRKLVGRRPSHHDVGSDRDRRLGPRRVQPPRESRRDREAGGSDTD